MFRGREEELETRKPAYLPGGHLGKMGARFVRAIRVPFFIPQKSLTKGYKIPRQIHILVSERVAKSRKSKVALSKGHDFQKFRLKFG